MKYICEQLDSLLAQTLKPDKIIILDDASTDGTAQVIKTYIKDHEGSYPNFSFTINQKNRGWKANFKSLIVSTKADYIFPCDQDDIWLPTKIEKMVSVMEIYPQFDVLACSVEPLYEEGAQKVMAGATSNSGAIRTKRLDSDFMYVRRPGCTYCIRGSFIPLILPYWEEKYPHDAIFWRLATLEGGLGLLDEPLIKFRRHGGNASARKKQSHLDRLADIKYYIDFIEHAERFLATSRKCSDKAVKLLSECMKWLQARSDLLSEKGKLTDLEIILHDKRFYKSFRSLMLDILLSCFKNVEI